MRTRTIAAAGAAALALAAAGCGGGSSSSGRAAKGLNPNGPEISPAGDIPDNQAYVPYVSRAGGYSVKVPEGWAQTGSGGAVTFADKLNSVRVETAPAQAPPTARDARQTEVPKLASAVKGFQPGKVGTVTRSAGMAVRITYLADSRPDSVTGTVASDAVERYVFFHKGKDVILTLTGAKGADNVDPWKMVTDSLRWTR